MGNYWCFVSSEPVFMHRGVSIEQILVNQSMSNPYYGCNWRS